MVILGDGSIAMHCLRALQAAGHEVVACLPETESLTQSARSMRILTHDPSSPLSVIEDTPCDWLISAANSRIIPPDILKLPRLGTLNFHDGPLPKYAGLNVLTRALIDGESEHGVTWHLVEEGIDTGDIVVQKLVPILEDDTSQSLSLRCLEAGIEAFNEIVHLLGVPEEMPRHPQKLEDRTYFGSAHWPREGMAINWHWPATSIDRLVRALDVGPFPNRIGIARFRVNGQWHRLRQTRTCPGDNIPQGSIVKGEDGIIRIGTADGCLVAEYIQPPLPAAASEVEILPESELSSIARWEEGIYRHESRWRSVLLRMDQEAETALTNTGTLSRDLIGKTDEELFCFFLAWAQLHGASQLQVGRWWMPDELTSGLGDDAMLRDLLHPVAPLLLRPQVGDTLETLYGKWQRATSRCQQDGPFFSDLLHRGGKGEPPMTDPASLSLQWLPDDTLPREAPGNAIQISKKDGTWICDSQTDLSHVLDLSSTIHQLLRSQSATRMDELPRIGERTLAQLRKWEDGGEFKNTPPSFLEVIFGNFSTHGDSIAIETANGVSWSYRRLGQEVAAWSKRLQQAELKPGSLIPLRLSRSPDMIAAKLAVMACGHSYAPISEEDPPSRALEVVDQCEASVAIGASPDGDDDTQWLHAQTSPKGLPTDLPTATLAQASDIACVFFTSGSTGRPKGVRIRHDGLDAYIEFSLRHYGPESYERSLWSSSVAFDSTLSEVLTPLAMGGSVIIPKPESVWSVRGLVETIRDHHITYGGIATALWSLWMRDAMELDDPIPSCLRLLSIGGGVMAPDLVERWLDIAPADTRLYNDYGPTEITVVCSHHEVTRDSLKTPSIPIGKPNTGDRIQIVDEHGRRVAPGMIGEIVMGGMGVADGYLHQAELTQERFVTLGEDDDLWYRSGDLGSWMEDGQLLFHGRSDDQVKIQGYRVEPSEIRHRVLQLEGVKDVEIVVLGSGSSKQLAAVVILEDASCENWAQPFQSKLEEVLPRYAVPRQWLEVEDWPRTTNGKVDRMKLAEQLKSDSTESKHEDLDPREANSILRAIRNVLNRPEASPEDSFFGQGGDSIAAINLQVILEKAVGNTLPLTLVYASKTLQDIIAGVIQHTQEETSETHPHWRDVKEVPGAPDLVFMPGMMGFGSLRHLWPKVGESASIHAIELSPSDYFKLTEGIADKDAIEHLSAHFADLIAHKLKGRKPILVGFSAAGWFAMETARHLENRGMQADRVLMVEVGVRHVGSALLQQRYKLKKRINHLVYGLILRKRRKARKARVTTEQSSKKSTKNPHPIPAEVKDRVRAKFGIMLQAYDPKPTTSPMTLVLRKYHSHHYAALKQLARGPLKIHNTNLLSHFEYASSEGEEVLLDIIRKVTPSS